MQKLKIASRQEEFLDSKDVIKRLKSKKQVNRNLKFLEKYAQGLGYLASDKSDDVFGIRSKVRSKVPIRESRLGRETVNEVTFELEVQNFKKSRSRDKLALATMTITAGNHSETYDTLLLAPAGNLLKPREYIYNEKKGKVELTHSWWSRFTSCLGKRCISSCLNSLISCSGTWAAYLGCVAAYCGGCFVICTACASCRCRWWCRWATRCCR